MKGRLLTVSGVALSVVVAAVILRAGITRTWTEGAISRAHGQSPRPVELKVWDFLSPSINEDYGTYYNELERIFEQRNPDIDVVYQFVPFPTYTQKVSTAMVGPNPPDVFQSSIAYSEGFFHRGMLRPLNDLLENNRSEPPELRIGEEAFMPSAWRHNHTEDGIVFGIPQVIDTNCMIWNLDILELEAGRHDEILEMFERRPDGEVDYDRLRFEAVRDWDHFRRIMKLLTTYHPDGSVDRAGFVLDAGQFDAVGMFELWVAANGGRFQHPAGRRAEFNSPMGVQAMDFLGRLYWEDRVCPPFRRQIKSTEMFEEGKAAAVVIGTWAAKDIIRDTMGWRHFAMTAFPPGPQGDGQRTLNWGNMLVIAKATRKLEAAWSYLKFVTSLEGNLLRLKTLGYNGPRLDFYGTQAWKDTLANRPFISNVEEICRVAGKKRHTEYSVAMHASGAIFETALRRYPDIVSGQGPYRSIQEALDEAALHVDGIFDRYNRQVARWREKRRSRGI